MRIGFVVQRYGREVNGGAEHHCRMLAERIARRSEVSQVTVFTTCAKDYRSWANHYDAGVEELDGVRVERFPTELERVAWAQGALAALLRLRPHPAWLESAWLWAQGPVASGLLTRLEHVTDDFDVFVFFTYLYHPTVMGLPRVPGRRILVPTAHDEPAIYLDLYRGVFEAPEALAFNCEEERDFALGRFAIAPQRAAIVGCGVEVAAAPSAAPPARERPYILYLGRIAKNKGVPELARAFAAFKARYGATRFEARNGSYLGRELELVLAGSGDRALLPQRADVVCEGFVSDPRKSALLAAAEVLAMPSRYESLSLVTLEAWTLGTPVLAQAACAVTAGHVRRSGGGGVYRDDEEFGRSLAELLTNAPRRREMALCGREYVASRYSWPQVERRFLDLARKVASQRAS